jgi:hypothetical protein
MDKAHPEYWRIQRLAENMAFMTQDTIAGCLEKLTEDQRRPLYEIFGILIFREDMLPPTDLAALHDMRADVLLNRRALGVPSRVQYSATPYSYP